MMRSAPSIYHGPGRALQTAEVGQQVPASRAARSCSERSCPRTLAKTSVTVGIGRVRLSVCVVVRPVSGWRETRQTVELPYRLHSTSGVWVAAASGAPHLPAALPERVLLARRQQSPGLARRAGRGAASAPPLRRQLRAEGDERGDVRLPGARGRARHPAAGARGRVSIWLRAHGRDHMVGPMDFTMNDECGVQIEGFERMPFIKQPWHPPYYAAALRPGRVGQGRGPEHVRAGDRRPARRSCRSSSSSPTRSSHGTASRSGG